MKYRKTNKFNKSKKTDSACRHCVYAMKNYITLGNRFVLTEILFCTKIKLNHKPEKPFKELLNCIYFKQDRMSAIGGDMEQYMFFVSRQLEETNDLLADIIDKLYPDEELPYIPKNEDADDTDDK